MHYRRFFFVIIVLLPIPALSAGFQSKAETKIFADKTMALILEEQFQKAFDNAKQYWPLPSIEIDGLVNQINQQWPIVNSRFGRGLGIEFIREEKIGESFVRYFYLHKFENHALYWRIDFYKPKKEWKINHFVYLDSLDILYE